MENPHESSFLVLDKLYKDFDEIYHAYARRCRISEATLWILYLLYVEDPPKTQRTLAQELGLSPQTVNSVLKRLETQGTIALTPANDHRSKYVQLTDAGAALCARIIQPLRQAEYDALAAFSESEREMFLRLTQKYILRLRNNISQ